MIIQNIKKQPIDRKSPKIDIFSDTQNVINNHNNIK